MELNEVNSIRYLLKEMDPSEEVEFERNMMRDQNLLIEVESLRITLRKVGKLPELSAPDDILNRVKERAATVQAQKNKITLFFRHSAYKTAAAAAMLALILSAGYWLTGSNNMIAPDTAKLAAPLKNPAVSTPPASQTNIQSIQPWVDRNEIISVGEQLNSELLKKLNQDYTESYNKLILVKQTQDNTVSGREILYTNSPIQDK